MYGYRSFRAVGDLSGEASLSRSWHWAYTHVSEISKSALACFKHPAPPKPQPLV